MGRYFRRRLLTAIPVFFGITFLVFVLLSLSPADVTDLGEGASGGAQQAALEEALGLDISSWWCSGGLACFHCYGRGGI